MREQIGPRYFPLEKVPVLLGAIASDAYRQVIAYGMHSTTRKRDDVIHWRGSRLLAAVGAIPTKLVDHPGPVSKRDADYIADGFFVIAGLVF
jgi:hypothetical protein